MANYFTADSHFGLVDNLGVIERDFRPFKSMREMNKKILKIWNKQVTKNDVIYHLGDFVNYNFKDKESYKVCFNFVKKIKAKVILILGNNEKRIVLDQFGNDFQKFREYLIGLGFLDVIEDGMYIEIAGIKFYLNHYPSKHKDGIENLFGHIHNSCFVKRYGFNVGVDNIHFKLFSEGTIKSMLSRRSLFDTDVYD